MVLTAFIRRTVERRARGAGAAPLVRYTALRPANRRAVSPLEQWIFGLAAKLP